MYTIVKIYLKVRTYPDRNITCPKLLPISNLIERTKKCKCLSNGICFYMYGVNVFTAFKNQKLEKVIETIKIQDPNNSVFYREN